MQVPSGNIGHVVYPAIVRTSREPIAQNSGVQDRKRPQTVVSKTDDQGKLASQSSQSLGGSDSLGLGYENRKLDLDRMVTGCSPDEHKWKEGKQVSELEEIPSLLSARVHASKPYRNEFPQTFFRKLVFIQSIEITSAELRFLKKFRSIRKESAEDLTETGKRELQNKVRRMWEIFEKLKTEIRRYWFPDQDVEKMIMFYNRLQRTLVHLFLQIEDARSIRQTRSVILVTMRKIRRAVNELLDEFILREVHDLKFSLKSHEVISPKSEVVPFLPRQREFTRI